VVSFCIVPAVGHLPTACLFQCRAHNHANVSRSTASVRQFMARRHVARCLAADWTASLQPIFRLP
jgi:hypothetical protein